MTAIDWSLSSPDWRDMRLAEQLNAGPAHQPTPCQLRTTYAQLDEEDREVLRRNMIEIRDTDPYGRNGRGKSKTIVWLAEVLTKSGYPVGRSSISRHINGQCSCESI